MVQSSQIYILLITWSVTYAFDSSTIYSRLTETKLEFIVHSDGSFQRFRLCLFFDETFQRFGLGIFSMELFRGSELVYFR